MTCKHSQSNRRSTCHVFVDAVGFLVVFPVLVAGALFVAAAVALLAAQGVAAVLGPVL